MSIDTAAAAELSEQSIEPEVEQQPKGFDFSFFFAKTGGGSIDGYIHHPLNIKNSKGVAQILRGSTGLLGASDLAIIDIGIGLVNVIREGKEYVDDEAGEQS